MSDEVDSSLLKFRQIPDVIRAFLVSDAVVKKRLELLKKHQLNNDQWFKLTGLLNDVYVREVPLAGFVSALLRSGIAPEKANAIALDFAGYEFLPISDYLGEVDALIRSLGGDPARFPSTRVTVRDLTPTEVVTELLHDHPVNVPAFLEHRLREILESRVRGVRKDDETIQRLTRAEKIGGVELPQTEAETLVSELASKIASVKISSDNEVVEAKPIAVEATPHPTLSPLGARGEKAVAASRKGDSVMPEDEREAETVREKVLPRVVPTSLFDLDQEIKAATDVVFAAFGPSLPKDIQERFRTIVASRLKGVRALADTREILGRAPVSGGMGFGAGLADTIMSKIEERVRLINNKREEAMNKEKDAFTKATVLNSAAKDESRKMGEREEIDRLYGSLTAKKGRAPAGEAKQIEAKPPQVARGATSEASPLPLVSPQTRMHDVRAVQPPASSATAHLTGPIEELRNLTIADFCRLSADPIEACRKLTDKLDLLQEQAYARRIEGIKAWQGSEVQKMYLEAITAAFGGGKPIAAAIADAQAAGRPTLTEREVHAIMEFNRGLKA